MQRVNAPSRIKESFSSETITCHTRYRLVALYCISFLIDDLPRIGEFIFDLTLEELVQTEPCFPTGQERHAMFCATTDNDEKLVGLIELDCNVELWVSSLYDDFLVWTAFQFHRRRRMGMYWVD